MPYSNVDQARINMLKEIMAHSFAAIDLNLFLDTHPNDQRALNDYNYITARLHMMTKQYEQLYGPLMVFGHSQSQYPWKWIEEPWPWDMEY